MPQLVEDRGDSLALGSVELSGHAGQAFLNGATHGGFDILAGRRRQLADEGIGLRRIELERHDRSRGC